jgi:hypothetical protein
MTFQININDSTQIGERCGPGIVLLNNHTVVGRLVFPDAAVRDRAAQMFKRRSSLCRGASLGSTTPGSTRKRLSRLRTSTASCPSRARGWPDPPPPVGGR